MFQIRSQCQARCLSWSRQSSHPTNFTIQLKLLDPRSNINKLTIRANPFSRKSNLTGRKPSFPMMEENNRFLKVGHGIALLPTDIDLEQVRYNELIIRDTPVSMWIIIQRQEISIRNYLTMRRQRRWASQIWTEVWRVQQGEMEELINYLNKKQFTNLVIVYKT